MKNEKKLIYIGLIYFFSGLPFGFFYTFIPVFLRTEGVSLIDIGLMSLAGLPWSLRLIFAPLIDRYFYKSFWMGLSLIGVSISILSFVLLYQTFLEFNLAIFFSLFFLTLFSSIFDTSADGFVIEWIEKENLGKANGIRIGAYRTALIIFGGGLVALSHYLGFNLIFYLVSLSTFLSGCYLILNPSIKYRASRKSFSLKDQFLDPLYELLKRPHVFYIFLFVLTYKLGDSLLGAMVYPFWVDSGIDRLKIGLFAGTLGSILTIGGSLIGGYLSSKWSIKRSLFVLGLFQAVSNLGYTFASLPFAPKESIYVASVIESFTGGLGTAAFLTFLTGLCKKDFSATQYSVFSTLFSLSLTLSRSISGFLATNLGYTLFFALTFLIALPAFVLIPKVTKDFSKS